MIRRSFTLLLLVTAVTGVCAKDWTTRYFTANGLNFERQKDNTMKLIKASQRTEYLGDLDEWGLTATNVTKTQKVGIAKYTEESYEIPAEVNGMPVTAMEISVFSGNANIKTVTFADGQMTSFLTRPSRTAQPWSGSTSAGQASGGLIRKRSMAARRWLASTTGVWSIVSG